MIAFRSLIATATFITKWGSKGNGDGQFYNPYGVAVDSSGNVYVADWIIVAFRSLTVTGHSSPNGVLMGSDDGQFNYPSGVAVRFFGQCLCC